MALVSPGRRQEVLWLPKGLVEMPLTHLACCGTIMTVEEALDHTADRRNQCEWTYELLSAMLAGAVAHPSNEDPTRISTTTLTSKCLRQQALSRFSDYTQEPSDLYAQFRGTMFHKQLEQWAAPGSYAEVRFGIEDLAKYIPGLRRSLARKDRSFSGSPDLVDPSRGFLYDYKRTKEVPRFNTVWGDHVEQLNINRWLVDHGEYVQVGKSVLDMHDPEVRPLYVPVEWQELIIVYVDDKGPKPIVATESIDVPTKDGERTKKARVPALWEDARVEAFIEERYYAARMALLDGIAPIPRGWEHQSHVLCGYCPVRTLCADHEREGE